jgi:hypothetical protein
MGSKAPSTTCGKCIPRDTSSDFFCAYVFFNC